jgi:FtsW/RodA/SpoVE-like cell cycle protein
MTPARGRTSPSGPGKAGAKPAAKPVAKPGAKPAARSGGAAGRRIPGGTAAGRAHADTVAGTARAGAQPAVPRSGRADGEPTAARSGSSRAGSSRAGASRPRGAAPGLRGSPGAAALTRAVAAFSAWLRRPLTSLHLILGVFGLLTLFGLVMVLSASAVESYAADGSSYSVFVKQLMFCAAGLVLFWVGLRIPPPKLRALAAPMLLVGILALVAVLVPGLGALRGGSRAWFAFGPFSVQPSEAVKVALTLWGAHVLALRRNLMHRWKHALSPVVPVSLLIFVLLVL